MSKARMVCKYWLPLGVWMLLIFLGSSDTRSNARSSRIIGPIVRWLAPDISEAALERIVFRVRKCAHLTEYAVLAWLAWRAWRKPAKADTRPWRWTEFGLAMVIVTLYAASDEFHQMFVKDRMASGWDVLLDACGGASGLLVVWSLGKRRNRW